jgi:hypothetical protein
MRNAVAAALFGFFAGSGGTVAFRGLENTLENSMLNLRAEKIMGQLALPVREPTSAPPELTLSDRFETMGRVMEVPIRRRSAKHRRRSSD